VIHGFWVPEFGWKMDAVPGIINAAWTEIKTPGVYRGQCSALCGQDHGYMPIVVKAVSKADFAKWLAAQENPPATPASATATSSARTRVQVGGEQVAALAAPANPG
jgi:cytochrome c oxidase subunit 2